MKLRKALREVNECAMEGADLGMPMLSGACDRLLGNSLVACGIPAR